jgi:hypothetical protein
MVSVTMNVRDIKPMSSLRGVRLVLDPDPGHCGDLLVETDDRLSDGLNGSAQRPELLLGHSFLRVCGAKSHSVRCGHPASN